MARAQGAAIVLATMALLAPVLPVQAWIITQTEPAPGSGKAEAVVVLFDIDPGIDMFEIHKFFLADPQPLVLMFTRTGSDLNDTIQIVDELILNMMTAQRVVWEDFHLLLEAGPGKTVRFINPGAALAWQQTGGAQRLGGTPLSSSDTTITWQTDDPTQFVPYGTFNDAPYNQLVLRGVAIDVSSLKAGESFWLKEWPTTPEPGVLAVLGMGATVMLWRRRIAR